MRPHRLRTLSVLAPIVPVLLGCRGDFINPNCADSAGDEYLGFALVLTVVDSAGDPATLGTSVRLAGPDSVTVVKGRHPAEDVFLLDGPAGRYTVEIERPGWGPRRIEDIVVNTVPPSGHCATTVAERRTVTLTLEPDAPALRQVVAGQDRIAVSSDPPYAGANLGGAEWHLTAWVEADPGVDTAVEWSSADPGIASVIDGVLTVPCREEMAETTLTVRAVEAPEVSETIPIQVGRTSLWECPRRP